ncbi:hypothetical protein DXB96_10220 [Clostridium sp. OM07-10AC]|nr:hypothetical protein DXB96_10220 [Clostridium sp. OM07-10AC]
MNVNDIIAQTANVSRRKTAFGSDSFLQIGRRGQVVQGVISGVSDKVSISFNGAEVSVPASSVQNATEGETRNFKIMEVSKERIVLKEVGRADSSESRAMIATTVSASSYSFSDHLNDSGKVSGAKQQAGQNIAVLTGEDYQNIESEHGALEEYKASALDRTIERHKENRQWQQENVQKNIENSKEYRETIKNLQEQGVTQLMDPAQIENALREADLPVTKANVARVASAVQMTTILPELSQDAEAYILENQMAPTIENLYHGQYSASGALDISVVDEEVWQQLQGQITGLLQENGISVDEAVLADAKWLFANEIAVTPENINVMQVMRDISENMTPEKVLDQIIYAMQTGASPEQASLDDRQIVIAIDALQTLEEITPEDVENTVRNVGQSEVTMQQLKQSVDVRNSGQSERKDQDNVTEVSEAQQNGGSQTDNRSIFSEMITVTQRQLEELRLRMTLPAAVRMAQKGIDIQVTPLKALVEELRQQEQKDYQEILPDMKLDESQWDRVQDSIARAEDIRKAPASILGIGARQHELLTMNVLHRAAVSAVAQTRQYQTDYEAVGTQVRTDLGDSIQKAFQNVPELLYSIGMEDTQANQRAVRILGYNSLEITEQNVTKVKELDAQVNAVLDHMKPTLVMKLVQQGENPLDLPLDELDQRLAKLADEQDISSEEKYSRYLWKLEQEQGLTKQERDGYIGLYRLMHQVEDSDGAAIGSVMEAGWEMNLRSLLKAVRTEKRKGVDAHIDDDFGGLSDLRYTSKNITQQIDNAFSGKEFSGDSSSDSTRQYYERLSRQIMNEMEPAALREISDGDMEQLLDHSLERLQEQLKQAEGSQETQQRLYEQLASQLRETVEQSQESIRYLEQMGLPDTINNIQAAHQLICQNYDVYHEIHERRRDVSGEEQDELRQSMEEIPDSLDQEDMLLQSYDRLGKSMEKILEHSYEKEMITSDELRGLKQLRTGMIFQSSRAGRYSYDVPVVTGDQVTTMNVTLIQGEEDTGRVQIYMDNISAEFRVQQGEIKGLVLCDDREGYDTLSGNGEKLTQALQQDGYNVKNISYSMNHRSRVEAMTAKAGEKVPSSSLYRIAKTVVRYVMDTMKQDDTDL